MSHNKPSPILAVGSVVICVVFALAMLWLLWWGITTIF
ncbi:MAG: hypothetical protein ACI89L_001421 [Phycisphaerales bacterium]|jgi:hypothetical protein